MALIRLPPYSPELNPAERLMEELREKEFANKVLICLEQHWCKLLKDCAGWKSLRLASIINRLAMDIRIILIAMWD